MKKKYVEVSFYRDRKYDNSKSYIDDLIDENGKEAGYLDIFKNFDFFSEANIGDTWHIEVVEMEESVFKEMERFFNE